MNQTENAQEDMKGLLGALGKSISDVAKGARLTRATIHSIVTGRQDARMRTLESIAATLGVPWERVVGAFRVTRGAKPSPSVKPAPAPVAAERPENPWNKALRGG